MTTQEKISLALLANKGFVCECDASVGMEPCRGCAIQDALSAAQAELDRVTSALSQANAEFEKYERLWYLRGDELERVKEQVRWRHVINDPWPDDEDFVLVLSDDGVVVHRWHDDEEGFGECETHWMPVPPLPEPPKGEGK